MWTVFLIWWLERDGKPGRKHFEVVLGLLKW